MISWLSIDVIDPPVDEEIIVRNPEKDLVRLITIDSNQSSLEWAIEWQMVEGYTLWSDVK